MAKMNELLTALTHEKCDYCGAGYLSKEETTDLNLCSSCKDHLGAK